MKCPDCGSKTRITDSRSRGSVVRRVEKCVACGYRGLRWDFRESLLLRLADWIPRHIKSAQRNTSISRAAARQSEHDASHSDR